MPKRKLKRSLRALLRESEQAAWDALARGDFSGFGLTADTWVAAWTALNCGPHVKHMPPLRDHAFGALIRCASNYRSATAPDYEGNT